MVLVQHVALLHLEDQFVSASLDGKGIPLGDANPNKLNQLSSIKSHDELEYNEVALCCIYKHVVAYKNYLYIISKECDLPLYISYILSVGGIKST